jgi:hypothetical protein
MILESDSQIYEVSLKYEILFKCFLKFTYLLLARAIVVTDVMLVVKVVVDTGVITGVIVVIFEINLEVIFAVLALVEFSFLKVVRIVGLILRCLEQRGLFRSFDIEMTIVKNKNIKNTIE